MIRNALILAILVCAAPALAAENPPVKPSGAAAQDCLITREIQQTVVGRDGQWYARLRNKSWWRNSMDCPVLSPHRVVVHSSPIGSQCRGDIVQIVDFSMGGVSFGGCGLGKWERADGPPPKEPAKPKG